MALTLSPYRILNGNVLKILACVFMVLDHIGFILFPHIVWLRYIGRLAYPIFAFLIAEGCRYTKNKAMYLGLMAGFAGIMMAGQYLFTGIIYGNIMVTFTFSILTIYAIWFLKCEMFKPNRSGRKVLGLVFIILLVLLLDYSATKLMNIDYGFEGIMLPVLISLVDFRGIEAGKLSVLDNHYIKLFLCGVGLILLSLAVGTYQWYCLFALIPLLLYNGQRGHIKMKYFFYIFYPVHIILLYWISYLI